VHSLRRRGDKNLEKVAINGFLVKLRDRDLLALLWGREKKGGELPLGFRTRGRRAGDLEVLQ